MTTSRATLRQSLATKIPGAMVCTASSTSSYAELWDTDDELVVYAAAGAQDLTGYWIIRSSAAAAGDRVRRVAHHDPGLGQLKPSRVWTNSVASETYELWPPAFNPAMVDQAINDGLVRLSYRVEGSITPVASDNSYALSSLTWIESERDVRNVYVRYTSSSFVQDQPWPWWRVLDSSGTFTLSIMPMPTYTTGITIIVEGVAHYGTLASDSATTTCPATWAVAAAKVEVLRKVIADAGGQAGNSWSGMYIQALNELNRLSARYAPRVPRRSPMWRTPTTMPSVGVSRTTGIYA